MKLNIEPLRCTGCGNCELACGYHRDVALNRLSSSIVTYRNREKKNYFGLILKTDEYLVLARPEGVEMMRIGAPEEGQEADSSAKPILLREACDLCVGVEDGPLCIKFCPQTVLSLAE